MKVIQVGLGGMGNTWLKAVQSSTEVTFAAFVEIDPVIAEQQAKQYGLDPALIFDSLDKALQSVSTEGVIDVTPPRFHRQVSLTALEAGIPVLSEKPLSDTLTAAQDIVQKANETCVLHMVTQNYRYSVQAQTVKSVLDSGELGRVGAVTIEFFKGPHFGGFREEMAYPLIIDMSIHHFDMLRFFVGSDPVSVFGQSWNPLWSWYRGDASAAVALQFTDGIQAVYNASWCAPAQETSWNANWRFDCEHGVLLLRDDKVFKQKWRNSGGKAGSVQQNEYSDLMVVTPVIMTRTAQAYLLHEFYEAVTNGKSAATACQDNIKSLAIVFNTVKSFETGAVVKF